MNAIVKSARPSTRKLDRLVASLRNELQEFGGLLCLLSKEQDLIFSEPLKSDTLLGALDRQHQSAIDAVGTRKDCMVALAGGQASPDELIGNAPVEMRPLISALFSEVSSLAARVEVFAHQNAWLRKRAVEFPALNARRAALSD